MRLRLFLAGNLLLLLIFFFMFQAKDRFPLIEAERRGACRKRALDSFDPDPLIFWKDLKMGKTSASRLGRSPPKPTGSADDLEMLEVFSSLVSFLFPYRFLRTAS
jgi:hypothetical protein